jgi:methylated-DNA-[protein]-cysteine S-methyltransferase
MSLREHVTIGHIVVPCHRVIGSSGKLVGYGGGLDSKERLLRLERGERRLI